MPVNDDLLAEMDEAIGIFQDTRHAADLERWRDALRAALAARPQPLFEGAAKDAWEWLGDQAESTWATRQVVVYPAPAGSATPTATEVAAAELHRRGVESWHDPGTGEAGSATPTTEDGT